MDSEELWACGNSDGGQAEVPPGRLENLKSLDGSVPSTILPPSGIESDCEGRTHAVTRAF